MRWPRRSTATFSIPGSPWDLLLPLESLDCHEDERGLFQQQEGLPQRSKGAQGRGVLRPHRLTTTATAKGA